MFGFHKTVLLVAMALSVLASAVSSESDGGDGRLSYDASSDSHMGSQHLVPQIRRTQGCLEVAILGEDENINDIMTHLDFINDSGECGARLCFDPDNGSIGTQNEGVILSNLGSFDVLIIFNARQFDPPLSPSGKTSVEAALSSGALKKLMIYDKHAGYNSLRLGRNVNVPGLNDGDVVRSTSNVQEPIPVGVPPITGPGRTVESHTLNPASRGYIKQDADILSDARTEQHYRQTDSGETTTLQYCFAEGVVYYSTIPLDLWIDGNTILVDVFDNALCHMVTSTCATPSASPTLALSGAPSLTPTSSLSSSPSVAPSNSPSGMASSSPSMEPTTTVSPTFVPTILVSNCKRWLNRCESRADCCSGVCRRGTCRLIGLPSFFGEE